MFSIEWASRCVVVVVAALVSFPSVQSKLDARGGDVSNCDTVSIGSQACAKKPTAGENECTPTKSQCKGCGTGNKEILCRTHTPRDICADNDCISNQSEGIDGGQTCITQSCN